MTRKKRLRRNGPFWLGILMSAGAVLLLVRKIEWSAFGHALRAADYRFVAAGAVVFVLNLLIRAWRWKILLRPLGNFRFLHDALAFYLIGYMANMLLPLRAGEIIRPYFFGRKCGVSKTAVLASVVLERLCDLAAMLAMIGLLAAVSPLAMRLRETAMLLAVFLLVTVMIVALLMADRRVKRRLDRVLRMLPALVRTRATGWLDHGVSGFKSLQSRPANVAVALATLGVWLCAYIGLRFYFRAFDLSLAWYAPVLVLVVVNLGAAIPAAPGSIGVIHYAYVVALAAFQVEGGVALAIGILIHGVGFTLVVCGGLISMWCAGFQFAELARHGH